MKQIKMLHFDLDGVLVDLNQHLLNEFGVTWKDFAHHPKPSQAAWAVFGEKQDLFLDPPKTAEADDLVSAAVDLAESTGIALGVLTAIPFLATMPYAELHKSLWVQKHFPVLANHFKIGPHRRDKCKHAKENYVLIDDLESNVVQWKERGGIGILHVTGNAEATLASIKQLHKIL